MGKTLRIQKTAEKLANEILTILKERHNYRWLRLIDQVQASAASVAHCISEGHGRTTIGEKLQMLSIANGSLQETITAIGELEAVGILNNEESVRFATEYKQLSASILLFAAAQLDKHPHYNGAYRAFALRGLKLRAFIRSRKKTTSP